MELTSRQVGTDNNPPLHFLSLAQDFVPLTLRRSARQLAAVRVWVRDLLLHTVLALGAQAVTGQLRGQDLVPRALRLSTRQLAAVRV